MLLTGVKGKNKVLPEFCKDCGSDLELDHQDDLCCTVCTSFYNPSERRWYTI